MKKIVMPLLVAGLFAIPSLSQAATTPYVSASGGLGLLNNSTVDGVNDAITYKTGYLANGAVGLKADNTRIEAEIGYHSNDVDTSVYSGPRGAHVSMWTFMANGYVDFTTKDSNLTPYVMGGLGVADASISGGNWGDSSGSTEFAWQVGAGVGIKASNKMTVDVGYRYLSPSDATFSGRQVSLASSNILVGIRCAF
ncbi:MAG: porin family protein [Chlorobiaceae bacterium]|nr:porin family protein [Chlorobiaceae bacterium]